ncbi:unnamed protein product [Knipowitschia caucasica]
MESPLFCADVLMSSQSPGLCLNQEIPETPAIKEEQLQECSPEFIALCVKREATEMETSASVIHEDNSETPPEAGEKKFQCNVCNKKFERKQHLQNHVRIHTGENPYSTAPATKKTVEERFQCSICKKRLWSKYGLDVHVRTHTGERPHSCPVCNKTFVQKGALIIHRRTHTGEKPYNCSTCEKTFTDKSSLNAHMKIHTGKKPHVCPFCCKGFIRPRDLDIHIKMHM